MDDTIRRQDAINVMCNINCGCDFNDCHLSYEEDGTEECADVRRLLELPSAQQEEKIAGWQDGKRMTLDGTFYWFRQCSHCGYERNDDNSEKDTNFCPDCGYRMERSEYE